MKNGVCLLTLSLLLNQAVASEIQSTKVVGIISGPEYGNSVLLSVDPKPTQNNCSTDTVYDYAVDVSGNSGEVTLSMALSAFYSEQLVTVRGTDTCSLISNIESLKSFQLSKSVQVVSGPDESLLSSWTQSQEFTSSGDFVVPSGVTRVLVAAVGGGGGGGGGYNSNTGGGGAGGGASAFTVGTFDVTPAETISITIGAGGGGGAPSFSAGGNGGATSFGSYLTAQGGTGGAPGGNGLGSAYVGGGASGGGNGGASGQHGNPAVSNILDVDFSLADTSSAGTAGDFNTGGGGGTSPFGAGGNGGKTGGAGGLPSINAYGAGGGWLW